MASTLARASRTALSRCSSSFYSLSSLTATTTTLSSRSWRCRSFSSTPYSSSSVAVATDGLPNSQPVQPLDEPEALDNSPPSFASLSGKISPDIIKALTVHPFKLTRMTNVQAEVLPLLPGLAGPHGNPDARNPDSPKDLFVKARTGTGKTIAFLIPAIEARLRAIDEATKQAVKDSGLGEDKHLQDKARRAFTTGNVGTLIISPTRELATQIANEAQKLTTHNGMEVRTFLGGMDRGRQLRFWTKGRKDIVVATPGRLRDVMENEPYVKEAMSKAQVLVLDEADTLLDMGFRSDIDAIADMLPSKSKRQTFLFTATVPEAIKDVARKLLSVNHKFINCVAHDASDVPSDISQFHTVLSSASEQIPHVLRLVAHDQLANAGKSKVMLFCSTTRMTQLVSTIIRELANDTLPGGRATRIYEIHSKKAQDSRFNTSTNFREDRSGCSILITSDVSARGVDYPGVTRVIQIGIPANISQYVHRVGRTGRAGLKGRADLVLLPWEKAFLNGKQLDFDVAHVSTQEVNSDLLDLSKQFDENPVLYWTRATEDLPPPPKQAPRTRDSDRGRGSRPSTVTGPRMFRSPVSPSTTAISESFQSFLPKLDEEAIKETFASKLGFYISKFQELERTKNEIIEGCKRWATEGFGLPVPPYVSASLLKRMGAGGDDKRSFGNRQRRDAWVDHGTKHFSSSGSRDRFPRDRDSEGGGRRGGYQGAGKSRSYNNEDGVGGESRRPYRGDEDGGSGFGGQSRRPFRRDDDATGGQERRPFRRNSYDTEGGQGGYRKPREEGGFRGGRGRDRPDREQW